ncbi:hypothetical protein ASZ90_018407 [hydrocarbon metagenome]|uniref:Uncharacterized protein n=1 Tax=hydrocarbon metagenome TaxID=938273 RepID=A0A0W8E6C9_9ZZZZ
MGQGILSLYDMGASCFENRSTGVGDLILEVAHPYIFFWFGGVGTEK